MLGRSPYGQWVHTDLSADVRGRIADVFITRAHTNSLAGQSAIDPNALTPLNVSQAAVMVKGQSA